MAQATRSYLYVPADRPDLTARAAERGSDALILDLEDGIRRTNYQTALAHVIDHLRAEKRDGPELWVRLGPEDIEDPTPLLAAGLQRAVFPKLTLARLEAFATLTGERVHLLGLVESAQGVLDLTETARHPAVLRLGVGAADLAAELRLAPTRIDQLLTPVRAQVVLASAAAGLPAPVAPTSLRLDDPDDVARTTRAFLEEGFRARTCVHPSQVAAIHRGLAPTAEELDTARRVLEALDQVVGAGTGSARSDEGDLVDEAVARRARDVVARAEAGGAELRR